MAKALLMLQGLPPLGSWYTKAATERQLGKASQDALLARASFQLAMIDFAQGKEAAAW